MRVQVAVLLISAFLTGDVNAQIPIPCATKESLSARTCCPVPDSNMFEHAGPCGSNLSPPRGSCELIAIPDSEFDPDRTDVRMKWPIQYFKKACVCNERFGGYDCGECSYAYNDGTTDCTEKTIHPRKSVGAMDDNDWENYRKALSRAKRDPSRYVVITTNFTTDLQTLVNSTNMVNVSTYNLFIWMHHTAAKDNEVTKGNI